MQSNLQQHLIASHQLVRESQNYYEIESSQALKQVLTRLGVSAVLLFGVPVFAQNLPGYWKPSLNLIGSGAAFGFAVAASRPLQHRKRSKAAGLGLSTTEINGVEHALRTMFERPPSDGFDSLSVTTPQMLPPGQTGDIIGSLQEFNAFVEHVESIEGPTFTRFRFKPARDLQGKLTSVSQIISKAEDLQVALRLTATPLIAIDGGYVTIDIPRQDRQTLYYSQFVKSEPRLTWDSLKMAIGVNLTGQLVEVDFADPRTPHIGGGGTTGSGKSEQMRSGLLSVIDCYSPEQVQIVLIDGGNVTFPDFKEAPHLLGPIANSPVDVQSVLSKITREMDRRYALFADAGVSNLVAYNAGVSDADKLPWILIWWDEYADTIDAATSEDSKITQAIDTNSRRIGQKGRKAGIHFAGVYTQKPVVRSSRNPGGVDTVFWGNLAVNAGFRVKTPKESEIVMSGTGFGADYLLGKGDMLLKVQDKCDRLQALLIDGSLESDPRLIQQAIQKWGMTARSFEPRKIEEIADSNLVTHTSTAVIPEAIPMDGINKPLPRHWALRADVYDQERQAVVKLYHVDGVVNKGLIARQVWGVTVGGGPSWESAKTKIDRILQEHMESLERSVLSRPLDSDLPDSSADASSTALYQSYRAARSQGISVADFICGHWRCTKTGANSTHFLEYKAELYEAIEQNLEEWVRDCRDRGLGWDKVVFEIFELVDGQPWKDDRREVWFNHCKKLVKGCVAGD